MRLDMTILESPAIFHISKILDVTGVFPQKPSEFRDNDCTKTITVCMQVSAYYDQRKQPCEGTVW